MYYEPMGGTAQNVWEPLVYCMTFNVEKKNKKNYSLTGAM